jgi:hypothetical protein
LQSTRNRSSAFVIAPKSSSVNDQLALTEGAIANAILFEVGVHAAEEPFTRPAKRRAAFPRHVIVQKVDGLGPRSATEVSKRRQAPDGLRAEQVTPRPPDL